MKHTGIHAAQVEQRPGAKQGIDGRLGEIFTRTAWQGACRRVGNPGFLVHDPGRAAVRNMVRACIPERVAMQMAGHKTRAVFDRYNIISGGELREAAQKLSATANAAGIFSGTIAEEAIQPGRLG